MRVLLISIVVAAVSPAEAKPVTGPAKIELGIRKPKYFLGENALVDFCVVNTGPKAIAIGVGGDYRGSSRSLRFNVEVKDAKGALLPDPDPEPFNLGGRGYTPTIEPKEKWCQSLPLHRYARVSVPGTYTITATHDLEWPAAAPKGTAKISFAMPTPADAERVIAAIEKLPRDPSTNAGQAAIEYADWTALTFEPYIPFLIARAQKGSLDAIVALSVTPRAAATSALVGLLDHADRKLARAAASALALRLQDPELTGQLGPRNAFHDGRAEQRKYLAQAWSPQLADPVRAAARRFLKSSAREDLQLGAFMLEAVGLPSDAPELIHALEAAIQLANRTPPETDLYPPPRGAMGELLRATKILVSRGLVASAKPATAADHVVWLVALEHGRRAAGWELQLDKLFAHDLAYVRELAMEHAPDALSPALIARVVVNLGHANVDVQVAAAKLASRAKLAQLAPEVVKAMKRATGLRLNIISYAAYELGARIDRIDMLVTRLADKTAFDEALSELCDLLSYSGRSTHGEPTDAERAAVIPQWKKLIAAHRADIEAGTKIPLTAASPSLVPPQWKLGRPGGAGQWP